MTTIVVIIMRNEINFKHVKVLSRNRQRENMRGWMYNRKIYLKHFDWTSFFELLTIVKIEWKLGHSEYNR